MKSSEIEPAKIVVFKNWSKQEAGAIRSSEIDPGKITVFNNRKESNYKTIEVARNPGNRTKTFKIFLVGQINKAVQYVTSMS